ncbi:class I fructose-bisphosphate aldolase [Halalkalibacter urbisdiaboli]|uniref:class I fructose-bisphosphate aldolase n=1 Tax=Halalkalibacter urbisdiaboli TaxID=1960589 RepID=UPI000B431CCE|nr:hypothetical protein [Halalkalibacter urbisdiaboli]
MSKALRLSRIFRPDTGNTLILPIDHGIAFGEVKGLENPIQVIKELMSIDTDAVLITEGIANQAERFFLGRNASARILTADAFYGDSSTMYHEIISTPEGAVRKGYDCLKVMLFWDRPSKERAKSVKIIADLIREAEKVDLPVMVEPLTLDVVDDPEEKTVILNDAVRIGYELGADILKVPDPGNKETLRKWCENYNVPFVLLGGGASGGVEQLITMVGEALSVGVRGVAIGRNVWQRPKDEAIKLLSTFASIIHQKIRTEH